MVSLLYKVTQKLLTVPWMLELRGVVLPDGFIVGLHGGLEVRDGSWSLLTPFSRSGGDRTALIRSAYSARQSVS